MARRPLTTQEQLVADSFWWKFGGQWKCAFCQARYEMPPSPTLIDDEPPTVEIRCTRCGFVNCYDARTMGVVPAVSAVPAQPDAP